MLGANSSGTVSKRHPISKSPGESPKKKGKSKGTEASPSKADVTEEKVQNIIKKIKADMEKKDDGKISGIIHAEYFRIGSETVKPLSFQTK